VSTAQLESLVTVSRQEIARLRGEVQSQHADNAVLRQNIAALGAEREQVRFRQVPFLWWVMCLSSLFDVTVMCGVFIYACLNCGW
jgi:UDP-N-acetylglucosamine enolpyruvyl transferase